MVSVWRWPSQVLNSCPYRKGYDSRGTAASFCECVNEWIKVSAIATQIWWCYVWQTCSLLYFVVVCTINTHDTTKSDKLILVTPNIIEKFFWTWHRQMTSVSLVCKTCSAKLKLADLSALFNIVFTLCYFPVPASLKVENITQIQNKCHSHWITKIPVA